MKEKVDHGAHWRRFRERHNLSQQSLALAAGLTEKTVWNVESGRHAPSYITKARFAALEERYRKEKRHGV
jgi:DNA-binding XRE family transcriptional regulator